MVMSNRGPDIKKVAQLAKLELNESEIEKFRTQLAKVIEHIGELRNVDTSSVEPTSQTTGLTNITRPDKKKSEECLTQDSALSGAMKKKNGYFVVDAVLEK